MFTIQLMGTVANSLGFYHLLCEATYVGRDSRLESGQWKTLAVSFMNPRCQATETRACFHRCRIRGWYIARGGELTASPIVRGLGSVYYP